jgi:hypothetical protein
MPLSVMLRRVALVRTDVSEELRASTIRVTRIGELGRTLTLTSNDARCEVILHRLSRFIQESHGVTSHSSAAILFPDSD